MINLLGDLDYVVEYIYNRLLIQWKHKTQNNHPEMITIQRQWNSHCIFGQETRKRDLPTKEGIRTQHVQILY